MLEDREASTGEPGQTRRTSEQLLSAKGYVCLPQSDKSSETSHSVPRSGNQTKNHKVKKSQHELCSRNLTRIKVTKKRIQKHNDYTSQ